MPGIRDQLSTFLSFFCFPQVFYGWSSGVFHQGLNQEINIEMVCCSFSNVNTGTQDRNVFGIIQAQHQVLRLNVEWNHRLRRRVPCLFFSCHKENETPPISPLKCSSYTPAGSRRHVPEAIPLSQKDQLPEGRRQLIQAPSVSQRTWGGHPLGPGSVFVSTLASLLDEDVDQVMEPHLVLHP